MKEMQKPVCTSIFKDGSHTTSKKQFTEKWIEMINTLEKNKEICFSGEAACSVEKEEKI